MNLRYVINQLGLLFVVLSVVLLVIGGWGAFQHVSGHDGEREAMMALLISGVIGLLLGLGCCLLRRRPATQLGRREALLLVAMSWLIGAALSGFPYLVWARLASSEFPDHPFSSAINCYFEAMSGLTTTGATILMNIHLLPKSLLLWRAMTHWLGGLGIVVLFVAVLPSVGVGAKRLFRVETPGPEPEGVHPHVRETARILWLIYLGLTVLEVCALRLAGMTSFDAVCHTFATLATGGFSTRDTSIGGFDSHAIRIIVIVFMVLAGVNFGLYYQLIKGRVASVWRDSELRFYLAMLAAASAFVVIVIARQPITLTTGKVSAASIPSALEEGVFTVVSLQTTTGFCTAEFDHWPFAAKAVLVLLMFVGGSAGSTGGGVKVIRVLITIKVMWSELERVFRPKVVRAVKVGTATVSADMKLSVLAYVFGLILIFGAGTAVLKVCDSHTDITTAATATAATLCNIGPGLGAVSAVDNYTWFSGASKLAMTVLMVLGRLEVFAVLVLFVPRFWRTN